MFDPFGRLFELGNIHDHGLRITGFFVGIFLRYALEPCPEICAVFFLQPDFTGLLPLFLNYRLTMF